MGFLRKEDFGNMESVFRDAWLCTARPSPKVSPRPYLPQEAGGGVGGDGGLLIPSPGKSLPILFTTPC